jgi:cardiolipin synthase
MHQKVVLVDDRIVSVGTTNLDNRSCRLNFEATAVVFGQGPAQKVADMLEVDFARSFRLTTKLDDRPIHIRLGAPVARLFSPIL